jgi:hypothetical protein
MSDIFTWCIHHYWLGVIIAYLISWLSRLILPRYMNDWGTFIAFLLLSFMSWIACLGYVGAIIMWKLVNMNTSWNKPRWL